MAMKLLFRDFLICYLLLLPGLSSAQIRAGNVIATEQQKDGVLFRMQTGVMKVQVCTPSIIHVIYSPDRSFPQHPDPMIVRTTWPEVPWKIEPTEKDVTLETSVLRVSVENRGRHIAFKDRQGNMLLYERDDSGGRLMVPATVNGEQTSHSTETFLPALGEAFYGLGQHQAGVWNYSGESVELSQENTNISIPFFVSTLGYGLFWNNSSTSRFDARYPPHLFLYSEVADTIDYYFLYGPEFDRIIAGYRELTGAPPLLGKWAYGFWQCKNRYKSQAEILGVAHKYRELGIPVDNIVQDWFWWTKIGSHIFNQNYPDPKGMVDTLHRENFHVMISVWPFFEPGTENYAAFDRQGWLLYKNTSEDSPPGAGLYDPFSPGARQLYWHLINESLFRRGFDAWWLDESEPETSFHAENVMNHVHTGIGSGARYANLFALMTTTAVYQGQRNETEHKRVFILTRSAAPGMQRNAAVAWSGDIFCTWSALKRQIPAGLNFSLSGLPYWTTDIGGFVWGDPADLAYRELFVRWFQYGTFCPIFRVHGTRGGDPKDVFRDYGTRVGDQNELWSYGAQAQSILTKYDTLRYRLMPYIYSIAWRVTHEGYTLMRPLVMDFREDAVAREVGDQFMFGPAILVNPVTDPGAKTRRLYLPQGIWFNFWNARSTSGGEFITAEAPLQTLPLYVRAGTILPMGPIIQYTSEKSADPIELRIYPGADADFTLYEDDGETYSYEKGAYSTIPMHWSDGTKTLTIGERQGSFAGMLQNRSFNIIWVGEGHGNEINPTRPIDKTVQYDGQSVTIAR